MAVLQQETFDVWREADEQFKQQLLDHMREQTLLNLKTAERMATVEEKQATQERRGAWVSGIVSAVVGGIVGAFTGRV